MDKSNTLEQDPRADTAFHAVAALPMYDLPQLKEATDAFWGAIAERLQGTGLIAPASLTRQDDYREVWRNPDLLLGQMCGYPLVMQLKNAVQIVATPVYGSSGCEGSEHCSFFIVNAKAKHRTLRDLRGSVCAVNGFDSNTGMNLLRAAIAPIAKGSHFFDSVIVTGSHFKNLEAIADDRADLAAIDCVSFAHFQCFEPELTSRVSKIGQSLRTAAPPFITAQKTDAGILRILRDALRDVAVAPELASIRSALNIKDFTFETETSYQRLLFIKESATALGYAELR